MIVLMRPLILVALVVASSSRVVTGFAPSPHLHCVPYVSGLLPTCSRRLMTSPVLLAKKQTSSSAAALSPSFMMNLLGLGKQSVGMESAVGAALILTNKKRQEEFKQDLKKQFPFVPPGVLDTCINAAVDSFSTVAPSKVKTALKPGGLEKVRPDIEKQVLKALLKSQPVQDVPLSDKDKEALLRYIVNVGLDYVLKDAQELLADPTVKLLELEAQKREIQRYMTFRQLTWYRLRFFPLQTMAVGGLVTATSYLLFEQYKHTPFVTATCSICMTVLSTLTHVLGTVASMVKQVMAQVSRLMGGKGSIRNTRRMQR